MSDAHKSAVRNGAEASLPALGLAHDLNNVFQTLATVAAHLEHEPELASAILRSVERGQQIVAGFEQRHTEVTLLDEVVTRAAAFLEDFQLRAKGPRVSVVSQVEPDIRLTGHWAWERVLINLFLNSHRAMPNGGTIFVVARHLEQGPEQGAEDSAAAARNGRPGSQARLAEIVVSDEGTGIAQEMLNRLFEPHASGNGSTGLGLHIVESIVHANGGRIHARNLTNGASGAQFVITVPCAVAESRQAVHATA